MHPSQNHLPFSLIADFAEGRQHPDTAAVAHLAACYACSADLAWLARTIGLLRESSVEEPPAHAVGAVKSLFRARPPRPAPLGAVLAAILRFDSARMAPAFALRSGAPAGRQLIYSAGPYDVDLRITPAGGRWAVSGQLLGEELGGPAWAEVVGHGETLSAELSSLYEFAFTPLRPGRYTLAIEVAGRTLRLPDVDLGA
jgi:hypothetical protein